MTREQFKKLKIGDVCKLRQGYSKGMCGTVEYIDEVDGVGYVLLKAIEEFSVQGTSSNRWFRLTNYRDLIIDD